MSQKQLDLHKFDNGFNIVYEKPENKLSLTSINVFVKLGSIYETDGYRGSSHFIEHLCFKGTKSIPKSNDISIKFDEIGADINAYTQKDHTCYQVKCGNQHIGIAIELLSDMLMNSLFEKKDYELEKKVVKEESVRDNDDPECIIENMSDKIIYNGSSYEMPIDDLMYHTNNKNPLKYEKIVEIYRDFYIPQNMVFSIVSTISFDKIKSLLKHSYFHETRKIPIIDSSKYLVQQSIINQREIQYDLLKKRGIEATHVDISFRVCNHSHIDKYCIYVLSQILGGSMSSRLFNTLREENGLTYESGSSTEFYNISGKLVLYAISDKNRVIKNGKKKGVLPLIIDLLNDLIKNGITEDELNVVKQSIQGNYLQSLENSYVQSEYNGIHQLLYTNEKWCKYSLIYEKCIKNITRQQVNKIITHYILKSNMAVCMVGETIPDFNSISSICERMVQ